MPVNTGSAGSNGTAPQINAPYQYQASGPFAKGVRVVFNANAKGFQTAANVQDVPNAFSVGCWLYFEQSIGGTTILVSKDDNDAGGSVTDNSFNLYLASALPTFAVHAAVGGNVALGARQNLTVRTLHFIAGTYTSGTTNLFIDGTLDATGSTSTGNVTQFNTKYTIGGRTGSSLSPAGIMYECRIDSVAWTAAQVQTMWATGMGWQG